MTPKVPTQHLTRTYTCGFIAGIACPQLGAVGGAVRVHSNAALATLSFPALEAITFEGSCTNAVNAMLENVEFMTYLAIKNTVAPLETVNQAAEFGGGVNTSSNSVVTTLAAPKLAAVMGGLVVSGNEGTTALRMDALELAGSVAVTGNANLAAVSFGNLVSVEGDVAVANNARLSSLSFPSLAAVGSDFGQGRMAHISVVVPGDRAPVKTGSFEVYDNTMLTTVSAPWLMSVGNNLFIGTYKAGVHLSIRNIDLPSLQSVGGYSK